MAPENYLFIFYRNTLQMEITNGGLNAIWYSFLVNLTMMSLGQLYKLYDD